MTEYLRRAGTGELADGSRLAWSVADGRRGRRWRAVATVGGAITHALLLEVDMEGRPGRLELTTPAGMLTLHPEEGSGALHGNVVSGSGVRHLRLPWSPEHGLEIDGRPIATAVTAHRLAASTAPGEGRPVPVVVIDSDLAVEEAVHSYRRVTDGEWRIETDLGERLGRVIVDARGVPELPAEVREWPLELD